jgi:MerR family transcriptional regulator, copper efflux regulator
MNIGQAANASGVSTKMIRYYESIGLIQVAGRKEGGYRIYGPNDVRLLRFIHQARALRFSIEQIRVLLALWQDPQRADSGVMAIVEEHIIGLDAQIDELAETRDKLRYLVNRCAGDHRSPCLILEEISRGDVQTPKSQTPEAAGNAATQSAD